MAYGQHTEKTLFFKFQWYTLVSSPAFRFTRISNKIWSTLNVE